MFFRPVRPDMHTSRLAWEASWQEDFDKSYVARGLALNPSATIATIATAELAARMNTDGTHLNHQYEQRAICHLQKSLVNEAAARFAGDDLERKWLALTHEERTTVVMEGIYRSMRNGGMETRRKWCPDSTLRHLTSRGGQTYLDILKAYIPADLDAPIVEPIQIPHPAMDQLFTLTPGDLAKPGMRTLVRGDIFSRAYCLTSVVWSILLTFYGHSVDNRPAKPVGVKRGMNIASLSRESKELTRQHATQYKEFPYCCSVCGKDEKDLATGAKLMACSKCRKIGRKVFYCSRECQTQDWRKVPYPHKTICGINISEDTIGCMTEPVKVAEVKGDASFPPADPSFRRSPALLHQISRLKQFRETDYMLISPDPHPDHGIILVTPDTQRLFRSCRAEAFRTGDPKRVNEMYAMLKDTMRRDPFNVVNPLDVKKQLEHEFGITVSDV